MDITYLLVICAALSLVALAALDALSARRATDQTPSAASVTHRAPGD